MYDYLESMIEDVKEYLLENYTKEEIIEGLNTDKLYDDMFVSDSITGNASGSYTFSAYEAEENLLHNMDLLKEACDMFGQDIGEAIEKGAEFCDVTIRCYLLGETINKAINELQNELEEE